MREPSPEKFIPTEYFDIVPTHQELKGDFIAEIINLPNEPSAHLVKNEGNRLSQQGRGDIVIMGISQQGWNKILEVFDRLNEPTIIDVKKAFTEQEFITWKNPQSGH